jgi:hypothetical protein
VSQCHVCAAKSQLFLCRTDIGKLSEMLADLPWWLEHLDDAVLGRTRMGDGGKGGTRREPFKGDDQALMRCRCGHSEHENVACRAVDVEMIEVLTVDDKGKQTAELERRERRCSCDEYVPALTQTKLRAQLLAMGRVNARASEQVDAARNTLTTWVRHLCETRGVTFMPPNSVGSAFVGPLQPGWRRLARDYRPTNAELCEWLAAHVKAIACDEAAGQCYEEIKTLIESIERLVNRPLRRKWLGQCPEWNERTRQSCGVSLWAREDAIEIRCQQCGTTHNCDRLKLLLFNDLEREKVPWDKILRANKSQPEDRQVPERTLQSWRRTGRLKARGYRRPNGREVINRHSGDDVPLYLWPDVRKLRDAKPQKLPTGAAARNRNPQRDSVI